MRHKPARRIRRFEGYDSMAFVLMVLLVFASLGLTYTGFIKGTLAHFVVGFAVLIGIRIIQDAYRGQQIPKKLSR